MIPWNTTALTIKTKCTSCEEQYVKNHRNFVMFRFLRKYAKIMVVLMRSSPNAKSAELSSMSLPYFLKFYSCCSTWKNCFNIFCYRSTRSKHSLILMSCNSILFKAYYQIEIIVKRFWKNTTLNNKLFLWKIVCSTYMSINFLMINFCAQ